MTNNFTVYLGSSGHCRPVFKESAKKLGKLIGKNEKSLVYGGMDAGLMGIIANLALSNGAHVTGIIPKKLKDSERIHPNLSETILVPDLWERKLKMFKCADVIVALAGGFGTIDEVLEALYWASLGLHNKPIVIVNTDNYWDDFITFIKSCPDLSTKYLIIAISPQDVFEKIKQWKAPKITNTSNNFPNFEADILKENDEPIIIDKATIKYGYFLATTLGLKQLDKHQKHIGLLNTNGQFDSLVKWITRAQKEHFITEKCTQLFSVAETLEDLHTKMDKQVSIHIDLNNEKWGPSETKTHIEIENYNYPLPSLLLSLLNTEVAHHKK